MIIKLIRSKSLFLWYTFTFNVLITHEIITFQDICMDNIPKDFMSIKDTYCAALSLDSHIVNNKVHLRVALTSVKSHTRVVGPGQNEGLSRFLSYLTVLSQGARTRFTNTIHICFYFPLQCTALFPILSSIFIQRILMCVFVTDSQTFVHSYLFHFLRLFLIHCPYFFLQKRLTYSSWCNRLNQ